MKARFDILPSTESITLSVEEFQKWKSELRHNCENFVYNDGHRNYDIKGDQASMGLSAICSRANANKQRIYFSGQGADEIISDYGFNGKRIFKHSEFGGKFPDTLEGFLWLKPELKNSKYKSCLAEYLTRNNFPFEDKEKRGFNVVAKGKKKKSVQ